MSNRTLLVKTTFYIIIATLLIAILVPFFFFLTSSFYSSYEVYEFPRSFLPTLSFDVKVTWEEDMYHLHVFNEEEQDYELLIYSDKPEDFRIFMKRELSIQLSDEEIETDFSRSKSGTPVYKTYSKDLLYNYKTFFVITHNADRAVLNSIVAAGWTILISLSLGSMAGYALARYQFRGKGQLNISLLLVRMFPMVAVAIPMLVYLIRMDLDNSMFGLAIVYSVSNIALTAWITNSIFQGINVELEEASVVFGASKSRRSSRSRCHWRFRGWLHAACMHF